MPRLAVPNLDILEFPPLLCEEQVFSSSLENNMVNPYESQEVSHSFPGIITVLDNILCSQSPPKP